MLKRILFIILILIISQVCFAGRLQEMQKAVIAAKNGGTPPAGHTDYTQDASCKGAWLFSEGTGTTASDSSGNNNTATFGTSPANPSWSSTTPPTYGIEGGSDYYVVSNGDDTITVTNDGDFNPTTAMTLCFWAKNLWNSGLRIRTETSGNGWGTFGQPLSFYIRVNDSWATITSTNKPVDDVWTFYTMIWNGSTISIYHNAVSDATAVSAAGSPTNGGTLSLMVAEGGYPALTEVAYFNRALDVSEMEEIMNYGLKGGN